MKRPASQRRMLLVALVVGLAIGLAIAAVDLFVDITVFDEGPLLDSLLEPVELWIRGLYVVTAVVAALLYAKLLWTKKQAAVSAEQYRTLAETAREAILVVDRERTISYMNAQAATEFGGNPEDFVGQGLDQLFSGDTLLRVEANVRQALAGEETYSELELSLPTGTVWIGVRFVPLPGPAGRADSALGIARDISAAKRELGLSNALARINEVVHAELSFEAILKAVVTEAMVAVGADSSQVMVREDDRWKVRFVHGYPETLAGTTSSGPAQLAELAISRRSPINIDDAAHDGRVNPEAMATLGIRSALAVPLLTQRGVPGVLLLTHRAEKVSFAPDVVDFASRVGATVSLAMENARLYEQKSEVADVLQTAMLTLPERLPGIEFAHTYRSATDAARVGGDFYDLFEMERGRVGVTIGDMSGHGIGAAALTSLVKNGIRVQGSQEDRPADEVISRANDLLLRNSAPEIFATIFFGILDLGDGTLSYCNAGHTTGCICTCDTGEVRLLPPNAPLVGAFPQQQLGLSAERLALNELLFVYTDGLTEARRGSEMFGEERLVALLSHAGDGAEAVVNRVIAELMSFTGNVLRDDLAILALRRVRDGLP